jgi:hypothetical protein
VVHLARVAMRGVNGIIEGDGERWSGTGGAPGAMPLS